MGTVFSLRQRFRVRLQNIKKSPPGEQQTFGEIRVFIGDAR